MNGVNLEQRLELIGERLNTLTGIVIDRDREYHERIVKIEAGIAELTETSKRNESNVAKLMEAMNGLINIVRRTNNG
jgi:hypothetical protein